MICCHTLGHLQHYMTCLSHEYEFLLTRKYIDRWFKKQSSFAASVSTWQLWLPGLDAQLLFEYRTKNHLYFGCHYYERLRLCYIQLRCTYQLTRICWNSTCQLIFLSPLIIMGCLYGNRCGDESVIHVNYDKCQLTKCINQDFENHIKQYLHKELQQSLSSILIVPIIAIIQDYLFITNWK